MKHSKMLSNAVTMLDISAFILIKNDDYEKQGYTLIPADNVICQKWYCFA